MRVFLTWKELYGETPTWNMVVHRIAQYGLGQVLETLGDISAVLHAFEPSNSVEGQRHILAGLFGSDASEIGERVQRWWDQKESLRHPPVLFHELQIVCAAKIALLELPAETGSRRSSLADLGEALLMVNDMLDSKDLLPVDPSTSEGREVWTSYFTRNLLFNSTDTLSHAMARTYDLYLTDRPELQGHRAYLNLPELARSITGFDPEELWTLQFGVAAHWLHVDPASGPLPGPLDPEAYFSTHFDYSPEESRRPFEQLGARAEDARKRLKARGCEADTLRPFDPLPFADKPLVILGGLAYCVSVRLLLRRLTQGLHFLFLNGIADEKQRARYLTHMGDVFEDYADGCIRQAYPDAASRYLDSRSLDLRDGSKACDGLLDYGDIVVLIETKATLFPLDVWAEGDPDVLRSKISDMFGDAADQIGATVRTIEAGRYADRGLDPAKIRAYLPLVVTLETLPANVLLYELIEREVERREELTHPKVSALQVVDISDLEHLMAGVEQAFQLAEFLGQRLADDSYRTDSMCNHLLALDVDFLRDGNPHLKAKFGELADWAFGRLRVRSRGGQKESEGAAPS